MNIVHTFLKVHEILIRFKFSEIFFMYFVFRWGTPCKAATAEGQPSVNIFNNDNYQ